MGSIRAVALSIAFLVYIVLERRLFIQFDTGGRGVLPYLDVAVPLLLVIVLSLSRPGNLGFLRRRRFWFSCGFYALLGVAYPILGLITGDYAPRHLLGVLEGILPVSFVALGYFVAKHGLRGRILLRRCLLSAILIQAIYAVLQFLNLTGRLTGPIHDWLGNWDQLSQLAYSGTYLVGRSTGLFVNPNELGFWSVIAFWSGLLLFSGPRRILAVTAALVSLILSQSRGSLVALVGSVGIWFLYESAMSAIKQRTSRQRLLTAMVPAALTLAVAALLITILLSAPIGFPVADVMRSRLQSGLEIVTRGVNSDVNFATRLNVWSLVPRFMDSYPLGTFGPPQVLFKAPIDNDFIRLLLQGSLLYVLVVAGSLLYLASLIRSTQPEGRFVGIATCALAINAITALPLTYSAAVVIWTFFGYVLFPGSSQYEDARQVRQAIQHEPALMAAGQPDLVISPRRGAFGAP